MSHTYQNGKPKTYCTSINITPRVESQVQNSAKNGANNGTQDRTPFGNSSESLLVASVEGKSVGGGPGVLYSAINGNPGQGSNGPKVNPSDPQVRKLVYNMYRGLLNTKHERANNIVEAAPEENVVTDEGVGERVISMMRHRTEQREGKMMNLGPPPPPPPPPFSTGAPAPAPKPPAEVPSKAPPPVAIPAALAGAMLKDKKPFTYTPGGLNLAEINAQTPAQQNGAPFVIQHTGGHDPVQSRSFKILQNAYDHQEPSGPPIEVPPPAPEPKKYAGSHIPSRSFRMLQTMTDDVPSEDTTFCQEKLRPDENAARREDLNSSLNINNPLTTLSSTHSPLTPSSSTSSIALSECEIGSRVAPSYTNTSDSHVYRHVSPKIIPKSSSSERVVNSALCARRDAPSKLWQKDCAFNKLQNSGSQQSVGSPEYVDSPPRLLNIIKQETISGNDLNENKRLYEGGNIPSRAFKQLQNDYSSSNVLNSSSVSKPSVNSSNQVTEVYIPRVMQQLRLDQRHPSSESINSLDEHVRNGVIDTAFAKESVLKELTSQFDPQTSLKKPKAAPGRVFRYLQQQYDDPQDSDFVSMTSGSSYLSNDNSPSFSSISSGFDSGQVEVESKPYSGCRIPGRTFRLLQENMDTHPSVLQARK